MTTTSLITVLGQKFLGTRKELTILGNKCKQIGTKTRKSQNCKTVIDKVDVINEALQEFGFMEEPIEEYYALKSFLGKLHLNYNSLRFGIRQIYQIFIFYQYQIL